MITDVHAHYHPKRFSEALQKIGAGRGAANFSRHPDGNDAGHVDARLEMMAKAGVGMQVLSPAAGMAPYGRSAGQALDTAKLGNDMYADLVAAHPDKFKAFVSLPLPHVDASLKELERGMDQLGMIGVNMHISVFDRSVAEDEFLPIYEEVNRRHGVIFYHPAGNSICSPMIADYGFGGAVGTSMEDTVIALHLIAKRIPKQFPNITYIIPHLGGLIPMLLPRLNNQFSMKAKDLPENPSETARRFYYDTVGHGSAAALTCARKACGAGHTLPGSDSPVLLAFETYTDTFSWIREAGLPAADVEQILEKTAPSILKLS